MKRLAWTLALVSLLATPLGAEKEGERLRNCATVLKEIFGMPDSIPKDLLDRAECVIVFPVGQETRRRDWRQLRSRRHRLPRRGGV